MSDPLQLNNSVYSANKEGCTPSTLYSKIKGHFESDQFYKAIAKHGEDVIVVLNQEGGVEFVGSSVERVLGYNEEDLLNKNILSFTYHRDQPKVQELISSLNKEGEYKKILFRGLHKNGITVYLESYCFFSFKLENTDLYVFVFINITDRKRKERRLKKSELEREKTSAFFKKLVDSSADIISLWSTKAERPIYYNTENPLGYNFKAELHIISSLEIIHPEDLEVNLNHRKNLSQTPYYIPHTIEYRARRKDGQWEWLRNRTIIIERDEAGYPTLLLSCSVIITDLKNSQKELETNKSRMQAIVENTKEQIWSVDKECRITAANSVFIKMYNEYRSKENPIGQIIFGHLQEDKEKWEPLYKRALQGETFTYVIHYVDEGNGRDRYLETSFNPIIENGEVQGVACFNREITDLKQTEADLRQLNFELDSFVYRSSHDMLAPLKSILGLVNILRMDLDSQDKEKYLALIEKSIKKLDAFIGDLISFSRNSRLPIVGVTIDFEEIINTALENLGHMEHADRLNVKVNINKTADFYSDRSRLQIIFQNFISNAIKYQRLTIDKPELHINIFSNSAEAVIELKDNGKGIREEYLPKVFDMFFRASEDSYGSGLGLYITRQAIEKLNGKILKVESTYGEGTGFIFSLPVIHNQ